MDKRIRVFSYFPKSNTFGFIAINGSEYHAKNNAIILKKWTTINGKIYVLFRVAYSEDQAKAKCNLPKDLFTQFTKGPNLYQVCENEGSGKSLDLLTIWYTPHLEGKLEILKIREGAEHILTNPHPEMTEIIEKIWQMLGIKKDDIEKEEDFDIGFLDYKISI